MADFSRVQSVLRNLFTKHYSISTSLITAFLAGIEWETSESITHLNHTSTRGSASLPAFSPLQSFFKTKLFISELTLGYSDGLAELLEQCENIPCLICISSLHPSSNPAVVTGFYHFGVEYMVHVFSLFLFIFFSVSHSLRLWSLRKPIVDSAMS